MVNVPVTSSRLTLSSMSFMVCLVPFGSGGTVHETGETYLNSEGFTHD